MKRIVNALNREKSYKLAKYLEANAPSLEGKLFKDIANTAETELGFTVTVQNIRSTAEICGLDLTPVKATRFNVKKEIEDLKAKVKKLEDFIGIHIRTGEHDEN